MYKMFFDTGVIPENRLDKDGKLITMEFDNWTTGTLRVEYWIETEPPKNARLKFLCGESYVKVMPENEIAIKIVSGGMLSEYAIFTIS